MSRDLLLGIDLGTTVLKAGVFAEKGGRVLAQASRRLPVRHSAGGGRELDAAAIDRAFAQVTQEVRRQMGARWRRVKGVGVAAQGGSSLVVHRDTRQPLCPMFLWNDARAYPYAARLGEQQDKRFWRKLFHFDGAPAGLGRLWWLQETRPELFIEDHLHIGAGEYLFHRLAGVWRQDAGNAIQVGSYNAGAQSLDAEALSLLGIPLSFVAPLRRGHETAGLSREGAAVLGLPEGVPVAGPYIDQEACYVTALGTSARPLQCSLGTAWVGNFELPPGFVGRSPSQLALPAPTGAGKLIVQPLFTGNTAWDWALGAFLGGVLERAAAVFRRRLLPPEGLVGIPWTAQQNPFQPAAYGAGMFLGVSTHTTADDLLRATAAGLVFELGRVFGSLKTSGAIGSVVLGGGASNGLYFRQLLAHCFDPLPVLWQEDYEVAAARGAVYAFSPRAAQGRVKPVKAGGASAREVQEACALYARAFEKVLGHVKDAAPFQCRARKR